MTSEGVLRIGLVGAGPWASMFTAPMVAAGPRTALSAVWTRRTAAAQDVVGVHGGVVATSFDDLLDRCDAVAFAVPPDVQGALAPHAAAAGKHLLLEKPLAFTLEDAEAIVTAVDRARVSSLLVLTNRFTQPVRDFLHGVSGQAVRAVSAELVSGAALADSPFATAWRSADSALFDLGPHVLDLLDVVAGSPESVYAARDPSGCLAVTTRHAGGVVGQALLSSTTPGSRGPLRCAALTDAGRVTMADPGTQARSDVQRTVMEEFCRAVDGTSDAGLDVHRGLHLQRLLTAVDRSVELGVPVDTR